MTGFILTCVVAVAVSVFLIVAVDAALEWWDRRQNPDECSHYSRCPECEADRREPPSTLDRLDGVQ